MAGYKNPLPSPGGRLARSYGRFARHLMDEGIGKDEAYGIAHDLQDLRSLADSGKITRREEKILFYEDIYDRLLDDYDVDLHSLEFQQNSPKSK